MRLTEAEVGAPATGAFAAQAATCRTCDEVKALVIATIRPLGFNASACGYFSSSQVGPAAHFYFNDWPQEWLALYQRENFVVHDFGVAEARMRFVPFTWSEAYRQRTLSAGEKQLWKLANAFGWYDGLSVPIHGPAGYFGLVTFASGRGNEPIARPVREYLHLIAVALHERCRQIDGPGIIGLTGDALTVRELECLRWVAAGLSDPQIAERMQLSATTVKGHVDAARVKLGARTRAQAITMALYAGLI